MVKKKMAAMATTNPPDMGISFDAIRTQIGEWLRGPHGGELWDLMCAQRGPDSPSETEEMDAPTRNRMYLARRERKYKTAEVIRSASWFGACGGAARRRVDDHITIPPSSKQDHFDRHMVRAATLIGLRVDIESPKVVGEVVTQGPKMIQLTNMAYSNAFNAQVPLITYKGLAYAKEEDVVKAGIKI